MAFEKDNFRAYSQIQCPGAKRKRKAIVFGKGEKNREKRKN